MNEYVILEKGNERVEMWAGRTVKHFINGIAFGEDVAGENFEPDLFRDYTEEQILALGFIKISGTV